MTAYDVQSGDAVHPGHPVTVDRYSGGARINHWITATSLVLLAFSGLALFHPVLFFLTDFFGGGQNTRMIHPWIGVVLFLSFFGLFIRFWRANLWRRENGTWLARLSDVIAGREEDLTEVGKYNAGQKAVFWLMSILIIVLTSTGFVIWDEYFTAYTTIDQKRLAVLVHAAMAVVIICVWIVHVYAAIWVRGTFRAMTRGHVTGGASSQVAAGTRRGKQPPERDTLNEWAKAAQVSEIDHRVCPAAPAWGIATGTAGQLPQRNSDASNRLCPPYIHLL